MNDAPSLISRKESTALKGLLILLVVMGHNSILMEHTGLFPYIYSFHVYCFYILPFLYGFRVRNEEAVHQIILSRLWKNVKTYYPLYAFWCCISLAATYIVKPYPFQPTKIMVAILCSTDQLRLYCGTAFLWFLPTLVAVMFWRDIFFILSTNLKKFFFAGTVIIWLLSILGILDYRFPSTFIPFALYIGLAFCFSGIATRWLVQQIPDVPWKTLLFLPFFAIVPLFIAFRSRLPSGATYLSWSLMPVFACTALFQARVLLSRSRILAFLGNHSLGIYLIHVFVFNFLKMCFSKASMLSGIIIYVFTLAICIIILLIAERTPVWWLFSTRQRLKTTGRQMS